MKKIYLFIAVFLIVLSLLYLSDFIIPSDNSKISTDSESIVTLANKVILREGSSENDAVLATLEKGDEIQIISKGDKWSTIYIPSKKLKGSVLTEEINTENNQQIAVNEKEKNSNSDTGLIDIPKSIDSISSIETAPIDTKKEPTQNPEKTEKPTQKQEPTNIQEEITVADSRISDEELSEGISEDDQILLDLVNKARAEVNAGTLEFDSETAAVAQKKAEDMNKNNYFDHTSPTYGSPFDMLTKFSVSYNTAGENIAAGQSSVETAFVAWMNSEGHRENIENSSFTMVGFGVAQHPKYNVCYVQMFIGK